MNSIDHIKMLNEQATKLTGISEGLDKEYKMIFYSKEGKIVKKIYSNIYKSTRFNFL